MNTVPNIIDVAIVGAGPAGLMAAMQAKRQGLSVALFEKGRPGGQALAANLIENFPGISEGIKGPHLIQRFLDQVKSHGVMIRTEAVQHISKVTNLFFVQTDKSDVQSLAAIVASGLKPKRLCIHGEEELIGKAIFSYINPDEIPCQDKRILVVGSGDAAFDQALNFAKHAKTTSIAMRGGAAKCAPILLERAMNSGIEILTERMPSSIGMRSDGASIRFENCDEIVVDFIITCIGKERNFDFMDKSLMDGDIGGLFFAGDCHRDLDRHISIACGDGAAAAMNAAKYISNLKTQSLK